MARIINDISNRICRDLCDYVDTCPAGHICGKLRKIESIMLEIINDRKE